MMASKKTKSRLSHSEVTAAIAKGMSRPSQGGLSVGSRLTKRQTKQLERVRAINERISALVEKMSEVLMPHQIGLEYDGPGANELLGGMSMLEDAYEEIEVALQYAEDT